MKTVVRRTVLTVLFLATAVGITFFSAPFLIDTYILPRLLEKIPSVDKFASISRITPFSATGTLTINDGETPAVSVPRFEIKYTPSSLFKQRISSLTIDHAVIHLVKDDSGLRLAGFNDDAGSRNAPTGTARLMLPTAVENLFLKQCSLIIHEEGQTDTRFSLSSLLHLSYGDISPSGFALSSADGSFLFFDTIPAKGTFSFFSDNTRHSLAIHLQAGLNGIPGHLIGRRNLVSGSVDAKVTAHLNKENMRLEEFTTTGTVSNFRFRHEKIAIRGSEANSTVSFALSGSPHSQDYRLDGLSVAEPVSVSLAVIGSSSYENGNMQTQGTVRSWIDFPSTLQTARLPFPFSYDLQLDTKSLDWHANLRGTYQQDKPLNVIREDATIGVPEFSLSSSLSGNPEELSGTIVFNSRPFLISRKKTALYISDVSMETQLQSSKTLNAVQLLGSISEIEDRSSGLKLAGITFDLPYHLPFSLQHKQDHGSIRVDSIAFRDSPLFAVDARLLQQQNMLQFQTHLTSLFSEEVHLQMEGAIEQEPLQAQLSWVLDKTAVSPASLPPALPAMAGLDFDGSLVSSGNLSYKNRQLSGAAQLQLEIDRLQVAEKNIALNNISCEVTFPSLPAPFSLPSQRCTAATLEFGNLQFSNADVSFRVEDADTVFIEKSSVNWCQGKLESTSLRLSRSNPEINTALYCSRINFSDLLNQFGLDQAEGQGSLNGKLPIALSKDGLAFDEGFLFSTPGTGGIIRFSNTDMLRQGVGSADVGGYLDYSMKAMEDFAYQWTKLSFNSSGDELLLTMQLNGKPRTPLPYGLKKGKIIKTEKGEGLQYPIQLDVNFRLPLAELFQIGQNIQSMKENM